MEASHHRPIASSLSEAAPIDRLPSVGKARDALPTRCHSQRRVVTVPDFPITRYNPCTIAEISDEDLGRKTRAW
jgi:hypothetical protein